jgi:SPP1 family predicted phage head-tail adaptor
MNAGKLNRRLTLKSISLTADENGQKVSTAQAVATVWAALKEKTGREAHEHEQQKSISSVSWIIRWRSDVQPDWILEDSSGQEYEIKAVKEYQGRDLIPERWTEIESERKK